VQLTVIQTNEIIEMVGWTGADAEIIFLRDGIFFGQDALFCLIVKLNRPTDVSERVCVCVLVEDKLCEKSE